MYKKIFFQKNFLGFDFFLLNQNGKSNMMRSLFLNIVFTKLYIIYCIVITILIHESNITTCRDL